MLRYCILCAVINGDSKANLSKLATDVATYALPRWLPGSDTAGPADYYVLAQGGVAYTHPVNTFNAQRQPVVIQEEVEVCYIIGYNQNVPQSVAVELARLQTSAGQQIAFNPPLTRAQIVTRLHQAAGENGCDHIWDVKPGDNVTTGVTTPALLAARFTAVG